MHIVMLFLDRQATTLTEVSENHFWNEWIPSKNTFDQKVLQLQQEPSQPNNVLWKVDKNLALEMVILLENSQTDRTALCL